ncbi:DNA-directed RNA polymerase N-terminal-domain-containing protein [Lyophyllum atratum]|nr:DNA-directed RNA polymerase N-terminal-domain-containing protein [Lyophyllum atratum]KAF8063632.1 DNA-directed RNA polymerase N-terminal-domain-containing protein [Lyophyllum atratum]
MPRAGDAGYFSNMGYRCLAQRRMAAAKPMPDGEGWTAEVDVACTVEDCSEVQPAFYHTYEYMRGPKLGVLRLNHLCPSVSQETGCMRHFILVICLVKPKPWLTHDNGGYLYNKTNAMRFQDSTEQLSYLKHAAEAGNVEQVFAGLDVLWSAPWKINKEVFDVVLEVWSSGEWTSTFVAERTSLPHIRTTSVMIYLAGFSNSGKHWWLAADDTWQCH